MRRYISGIILIACFTAGCRTASTTVIEALPVVAPAGPVAAYMPAVLYKGQRITFSHPSDINLRKLEARLRTRWFTVSEAEHDLFTNPAYSEEQRITSRLEAILLRAEQILGMKVPRMEITVRVLKTRAELLNEYLRIAGVGADCKSFYSNPEETIFSSMQDISDSVISHEMAHAVIDHYFNLIPPEKTAELLATYVDSHLEKE
jgi:hypothetical protein